MDRPMEGLRLLNFGDKGKIQKDQREPCNKLPGFQDTAHGQKSKRKNI